MQICSLKFNKGDVKQLTLYLFSIKICLINARVEPLPLVPAM